MKWISAEKLMKKWKIEKPELFEAVKAGLPCYVNPMAEKDARIKSELLLRAMMENEIENLFFLADDVLTYEAENGMDSEPLTGAERTELGRLRREKAKWDQSIDAAVTAGLLCSGRKIIKADLQAKLPKDLPTTTFNRIWAALPEEVKYGSGRQKKPPK